MSTLDRTLRKKLSDTIIAARQVAEEAAEDAVRRLGIVEDEAPTYLNPDQRAIRIRLRAHARALGDQWNAEKKKLLTTAQLENEAAYEIWHRMLFGRFLVERGLLIHPDLGVPIAAAELADLAQEVGLSDPWALVERFAAPSLPAVFKPDDPVLAITIDPALAKRLRDLVAGLPMEVFTADDSLGWTYQFWRTAEKKAVNDSGVKIGAAELPAVTQLFTEGYMVKFLLHNTLGAWWAGKVLDADPKLARNAPNEQSLRDACALPGVEWDYLQFVREGVAGPWTPAAGRFPGWPSAAAKITYCDPCCGSGHFLVEAFTILTALREREEGLSSEEAVQAVLQDNLHGLELDGRCVQIAAFSVALAAWRVANSPIPLPQPHIAWVGSPPPLSLDEMADLAGEDKTLRSALRQLHGQFSLAPLLGSLLEVGARDLLDADLRSRASVALALLRETEPELAEGAIAARGLFDAAGLLSKQFWLVVTNPPFLGQGEFADDLLGLLKQNYRNAKGDLCTAMIAKMRRLVCKGGTVAAVTKQEWCFLPTFLKFRVDLLERVDFRFFAFLGEEAWEAFGDRGPKTILVSFNHTRLSNDSEHFIVDAAPIRDRIQKDAYLSNGEVFLLTQDEQKRNPKSRISASAHAAGIPLSHYASCFNGIVTGNSDRFSRAFWELPRVGYPWILQSSAGTEGKLYSGLSKCIRWDDEFHSFIEERLGGNPGAWIRGIEAWGRTGIVVSGMRYLHRGVYTGTAFDNNCSVVIPKDKKNFDAIWYFCNQDSYFDAVRRLNPKVSVTDDTFVQVPFDIDIWTKEAERLGPLPEPYSDDPTQWLFHGHPAFSEEGTQLHVGLARVAGFKWPSEYCKDISVSASAQTYAELVKKLPAADPVGILPIHQTSQHLALADRIRECLACAYGQKLSLAQEIALVRAADQKFDKREGRSLRLEGWLRDRAFRQHCTLFSNKDGHGRPFIWQISDGIPDGFSAFVHYSRLTYDVLEKLAYSVIGDYVAKARAESRTAHEDRALQLQQRLRAILDGENPYDIFVRWKPLSQQPVGWQPDLNDGVRVNIRPFVLAGVLREQPRISWGRDRGTDPSSAPWYHLGPQYSGKEGDRINDHHLTLAEKRAARGEAA